MIDNAYNTVEPNRIAPYDESKNEARRYRSFVILCGSTSGSLFFMELRVDRKCKKCEEVKSIELFEKHKQCRYGRTYTCIECAKGISLNYYASHRVEQRKKWNDYWRKHKAEKAEMDRRYRAKNLKRLREYDKWRWRNHPQRKIHKAECWNRRKLDPEVMGRKIEYNKQYVKDHATEVNVRTKLRRARMLGVEENFLPTQIKFVRKFWNDKCGVCGRTRLLFERKHFPIDHWLPLSAGHALTMDNAVLMCPQCNCKKSSKPPIEMYSPQLIGQIEALLRQQKKEWEETNADTR